MTATNPGWASDVPVSMPQPYSAGQPVLVDLGGFGFTVGGLAHNLSQSDAEELSIPYFAPEGDLH